MAACSGITIDRDGQGRADFTHAIVPEPTEAVGQHTNSDAFDRIEVDG